MNAHTNDVIFKEHINARIPPPEPSQKRQRRPLGLAPVIEEISSTSALEGRSEDELSSPASVRHVLEALDIAIAIRTEIERPLKVQLGHLESSNSELRAELAAATAAIATLTSLQDDMRTTVDRLQASNDKLRASLEWTRELAFKTHERLRAKDHPVEEPAKTEPAP
jgi:hypothetical protein